MKRRAALGILLAVEIFIGREARILRIAELSGLFIGTGSPGRAV